MKTFLSLLLFFNSYLIFAIDFDCQKIHLDKKTYHGSLFVNDEYKGNCNVTFNKDQEIPNFFFKAEASNTYKPLKSYSFSVETPNSSGQDEFAKGLSNYSHAVLLQIESMCYVAWYNANDYLELNQVKSFNPKDKSFELAGDAPSTSNPDKYKVVSTWKRRN